MALSYMRVRCFNWMRFLPIVTSSWQTVLTRCGRMFGAGQLVMGDATYNHIYNGTDSTDSVTQRIRPENAAHVQQEDQDASGELQDEARAPSSSPEADAQDGLDALHHAIVSNTDGSVSLNAAGTPTGTASLWQCSCSRMLIPTCQTPLPLYRYAFRAMRTDSANFLHASLD